jgi:hypothetical protein
MAACDVLLMPWKQNDWIEACNPIKLKEYLAVGRPIVSTPFAELRRYEGLVNVASEGKGFAEAIQQALAQPIDPQRLRIRVERETWRSKCAQVLDHLASENLFPQR